jgi:hypothetical protein
MSVLTSYLIVIYSLFPLVAYDSYCCDALTSQTGERLLMDTLELNLAGPYYDVGFYHDNIIFIKAGEAINCLTPQDQPDPASARPVFTNKKFSTSPASFSFPGDYSKGYYTRSLEKDSYRRVEKIFEMLIEDEQVSGLRQLSFTADQYRYLHPAVSLNDSVMIFSSDRLPTSGGLDLFVVRNTPDGWSEPLSLGEEINSSGHECFPFLDGGNNLWFSSTGHSGYGGYDIFVCAFNGQGWAHPRNLGRSLNGPNNELGISFHPDKQVALFSSVDPSGAKGMAIRITLNKEASISGISRLIQEFSDPAPQASGNLKLDSLKELALDTFINEKQEAEIKSDPGKITFRVQIKSSKKAKSTPLVKINESNYQTFEYYYKGSFRITVGQFETVGEANAFRLQCKESGFDQAFVAAFRGDKRETDPSVFKQ